MNNAIGLAVTLRVRLSLRDAYQPGGVVSPSRLIALFHDVASELMIRLDGDEGALRQWQQVEMRAPAFVGDFIEATGVVTKIGSTSRLIEFEARRVAGYLRDNQAADTAAGAFASPVVIARATGTWFVPRAQQRRPRLVLPALPPAGRRRGQKLTTGDVIVTPPPSVIVTPAPKTPIDIIVAASILGPTVSKDDSPHVPDTPEKAAAEAVRCTEAGASVIAMGFSPTGQEGAGFVVRVKEYIDAVRANTNAIISVSIASAPSGLASEDVARLAEAGADMIGLPTGSFNLGSDVVLAPRLRIREAATSVHEAGGVVLWEGFDLGHVGEIVMLTRDKIVSAPPRVFLTFGVPGAMGARDEDVTFVTSRLPRNAVWFAAGVGRHQRRVTELAVRLGGHIRVGLADNLYFKRQVLAESSAVFVQKALSFASQVGRKAANPKRARELLGLDPSDAPDVDVAQHAENPSTVMSSNGAHLPGTTVDEGDTPTSALEGTVSDDPSSSQTS